VIPPDANAEFVYHLEDVLDVYTRPVDPKRPVVCLDEISKQLVGETRPPLPPQPGQPERYDAEYVRNGVANLFMLFEPLRGVRHVTVTERRTRVDWANVIKDLVDVHYADADTIVLVMDQLNTHHPASLYEAFPPTEAKRLADKLEIHHTPKHGSWLNMAEIELSVLSRQCLDRRIPDQATVRADVDAWQAQRNQRAGPIDWRFTTEDARIKLKRLYPSINE
jgi:hypothetical protein